MAARVSRFRQEKLRVRFTFAHEPPLQQFGKYLMESIRNRTQYCEQKFIYACWCRLVCVFASSSSSSSQANNLKVTSEGHARWVFFVFKNQNCDWPTGVWRALNCARILVFTLLLLDPCPFVMFLFRSYYCEVLLVLLVVAVTFCCLFPPFVAAAVVVVAVLFLLVLTWLLSALKLVLHARECTRIWCFGEVKKGGRFSDKV